ncbi:hypothetical protein [Nocardia farcinica]|uniref:hypothetical protein n=1 Tax=Nocardia farcinica TaxID=37329 RepID=UPI002455AEC2|nr:hypothetical protein [Nocardia farcinica]
MDRAWSADDTITVRQVYGDLLRDREIAYTTVMTTVAGLWGRGGRRGTETPARGGRGAAVTGGAEGQPQVGIGQ